MGKWNPKDDKAFLAFKEYTELNKDITYEHTLIPMEKLEHRCKWVGGRFYDNRLIGITNCAPAYMYLRLGCSHGEVKQLDSCDSDFMWTGGSVYNDSLYFFPRTANEVFCFDKSIDAISRRKLKYRYKGEHHYGGVMTDDGIIYQPPRDTDHILVIDVKEDDEGWNRKIQLKPRIFKKKLRYCGSLIHPNGFIYFFPEEDDRVIKLDPKTDEWKYIGEKVSTMTFNAKVARDGNIYGYSAYRPGIMKIDVEREAVSMIHTDTDFGAFGTKMGINGKLYSIPGDGDKIYAFDTDKDEIAIVGKIDSDKKAKFAGGAAGEDGSIYGIPAEENMILKLTPVRDAKADSEESGQIPKECFSIYFEDDY